MLWNAHAGALWRRFSIYLRREIAKRAGLTQRAFRDHARVSFAKVAEYQKRGAVHFHAVIRLDGPEGGESAPPAWASAELLTDAIHAAATATRVNGPNIDGRAHTFTFGRQLDVRTIRSADFDGGQELTERAVAAYIAKYATKGAETATGTLDRPIRFLAELAQARISDHARRVIRTAWALGARKDLEHLRLRAWAHMLGFRGHFSTKSRRYSTTLGALRDARAEWRRAQVATAAPQDGETTLVLAHWVFAGTGLSNGEALARCVPRTRPRNGRRTDMDAHRDELMTVRQVLDELGGVSRRTFYRWRELGYGPTAFQAAPRRAADLVE